MGVLLACIAVQHGHAVHMQAREGVRSPGTEVMAVSCPVGCWVLNLVFGKSKQWVLLNAGPSLSVSLSCFKSYLLTICMELLFSNLLIKLLRSEIRKVGVLGSSWSFPGGMGGRGQATRSSLHSLGGFLRNSYSFRKLPATNLVIESADLVGGSSQSACGKNHSRFCCLVL